MEACFQFQMITKKKLDPRLFEDPQSFDELKARISLGKKGDDPESKATREKILTIVSVIQTLTAPVKTVTDVVSDSSKMKSGGTCENYRS